MLTTPKSLHNAAQPTERSTRLQRLYKLSAAADDAYTLELQHEYGKHGTDARYDLNRNAATPMLRLLAATLHLANDARHAAAMELLATEGYAGLDQITGLDQLAS